VQQPVRDAAEGDPAEHARRGRAEHEQARAVLLRDLEQARGCRPRPGDEELGGNVGGHELAGPFDGLLRAVIEELLVLGVDPAHPRGPRWRDDRAHDEILVERASEHDTELHGRRRALVARQPDDERHGVSSWEPLAA
jgi:hypothetical protein